MVLQIAKNKELAHVVNIYPSEYLDRNEGVGD